MNWLIGMIIHTILLGICAISLFFYNKFKCYEKKKYDIIIPLVVSVIVTPIVISIFWTIIKYKHLIFIHTIVSSLLGISIFMALFGYFELYTNNIICDSVFLTANLLPPMLQTYIQYRHKRTMDNIFAQGEKVPDQEDEESRGVGGDGGGGDDIKLQSTTKKSTLSSIQEEEEEEEEKENIQETGLKIPQTIKNLNNLSFTLTDTGNNSYDRVEIENIFKTVDTIQKEDEKSIHKKLQKEIISSVDAYLDYLDYDHDEGYSFEVYNNSELMRNIPELVESFENGINMTIKLYFKNTKEFEVAEKLQQKENQKKKNERIKQLEELIDGMNTKIKNTTNLLNQKSDPKDIEKTTKFIDILKNTLLKYENELLELGNYQVTELD